MFASSFKQAITHVCMIAFALVASPALLAQTRTARPVSVVPAAGQPQPLQFFTISERLAILRAGGAVAPAKGADLIDTALPAGATPRAIDLGLRLSVPSPAPADTILGAVPFHVPGGDLAEKWREVMARWPKDAKMISACSSGVCAHRGARKWLDIRQAAEKKQGMERLFLVHSAFNHAIAYGTDFQIFGKADYWATPLEVVERAGDCEDYAIAKYLMLTALGFDPADMKLVAIHETFSGQYHAILGVRVEGEWLFMDNKRGGLTREQDYGDTRPVAVVDDGGQSMLVGVTRDRDALRLNTL